MTCVVVGGIGLADDLPGVVDGVAGRDKTKAAAQGAQIMNRGFSGVPSNGMLEDVAPIISTASQPAVVADASD